MELSILWKKIEDHSSQRVLWINDLENATQDIEKNRALLVC